MLKLRDLAVGLLALGQRLLADIAAVGSRIGPQRKQFRDLAQGKTEFLRLPDETDALDDLIVIEAVAATAVRGRAGWAISPRRS